jgi:hypothetical protein
MHRWTSLTFGLLFVAAVIGIVLASRLPQAELSVASASPSASAPVPLSSENPVVLDAGVATDAEADSAIRSAFQRLPDGGPVPKLPDAAPKSVELGVVLFQYRGAQNAPTNSRSRQEARAKAEAVIELAKKDFDEAVKLGDPGSLANAGNIPRNVLEPAVEYSVFTLEPGAVHLEALDTPRGFWIVRRLK